MRVVIFDFFGVICSEIAPFVLPRYMSEAQAAQYKSTVVLNADLGFITQEAMFEALARIARVPATQLERDFWSQVKIDTTLVTLIEQMRGQARLGLLTNAIIPFVRTIMAEHDLERLFDTILVSAEEHMAKPDPAFYRLMLKRMDAAPEDCLFIDDNPANIDGAKRVGINALVFRSTKQLKVELATRFGMTF